MVPALVVHCTNEVENRGLSEVGIYRVPGAEKDVKELKVFIFLFALKLIVLIDICFCYHMIFVLMLS